MKINLTFLWITSTDSIERQTSSVIKDFQ